VSVDRVDVLVIAALQEEFDAAKAVGTTASAGNRGEPLWRKDDSDKAAPFLLGELVTSDGRRLSIALARPTSMGDGATGLIATTLTERLKPSCLAMCGICAGNRNVAALGDVVVAHPAYAWDEGELSTHGFKGEHRQVPLHPEWVRAAQDFDPSGLPSYGPPEGEEATLWLLERLLLGQEPRTHPARERYFPADAWKRGLAQAEADQLIAREPAGTVTLTDAGRALVRRKLHDEADGPQRLPFRTLVGPMASGRAVVRDEAIWERLENMGMRHIAAVDMEAATIANIAHHRRVPHWLVAKSVVDHADAFVDSQYRRFAARASAEVLYALIAQVLPADPPVRIPAQWVATTSVVEDVTDTADSADSAPASPAEVDQGGPLTGRVRQVIAAATAALVLGAIALIVILYTIDGCDDGRDGAKESTGRWLAEMPKAKASGRWHNEEVHICGRRFTNNLIVEPTFCPAKPATYAEFDLGGSYRRFEAEVGISDAAPDDENSKFVVYADHQRIFETTQRKGQPPARIDVAVGQRRLLRIEIQQYQYCRPSFVWGQPTLSS
jgi:nucleoside phosphorylase